MAEQELIGIREFARRVGVSDTAVHKAIKSGRIVAHEEDRDPNNGRPRLRWPQAREDYQSNSDSTKRTHVGGTGKSERRLQYTAGEDSKPVLQTREQVLGTEPPHDTVPVGGDALPGRAAVQGPSLAQSKAVREAYMARLAKLEYEEKSGKLVSADEVKARAFKMARGARDALLTMPDRLAPILAGTTDVQAVHRMLLDDIEQTCRRIAADAERAA